MNRGSYPRRYDLDALRVTAMLLGIVLHAGLSFTPFPWAVQDERQSGFFWFLFAAIHGFRMPVFFVLSGFFTAMLWRGRGLKPVLSHRFRRVLLPFLLGLVTIVPAVNWISGWAIASRLEANAAKAEENNIWNAAKNGDLAAIERHVQEGADINGIDPAFGQTKSAEFLKAMASPIFALSLFHHLWFLWFLCWLVLVFALYARLADWLQWQGPPKWLVLSPVRFLYLIPLTMIPQSLMGLVVPSFGPDTSLGLLPMPHIFFYYALFFFFGTLYFDCDDPDGRVGKWWWLALPVGLFIVFPFGLEFSTGAFGFRQEIFDPAMAGTAAVALQVIYAWMMTFGFIGLFRKLCTRENKTIRYVSDSSYWLYVTHVPLIIGAQLAVRDWPLASGVKYFLVFLAVTGLLLLIYQFLVRYTWLGRLLNGPRVRPTS